MNIYISTISLKLYIWENLMIVRIECEILNSQEKENSFLLFEQSFKRFLQHYKYFDWLFCVFDLLSKSICVSFSLFSRSSN